MRAVKKHYPFDIREFENVPNDYTTNFDYHGIIKRGWDERANVWVETATPEEIAAFENQKEFETDLEFARKKKSDGQQFYEEIDARQVAMMRGKTPDEIDDLDVEYKRKILPYIEVVAGGQWWTAKRLMNNTTLPKIDIVKDLFIEVRQRIRDYVTNNY